MLQLVVLDRLAYCANMRSLEPHISSGRVKFVKGDVTNADMVLCKLLLHLTSLPSLPTLVSSWASAAGDVSTRAVQSRCCSSLVSLCAE